MYVRTCACYRPGGEALRVKLRTYAEFYRAPWRCNGAFGRSYACVPIDLHVKIRAHVWKFVKCFTRDITRKISEKQICCWRKKLRERVVQLPSNSEEH